MIYGTLETIGTMAVFSFLFLWGRAVWTLAKRDDGVFDWAVFGHQNRDRVILMGIGIVAFAVAWEIDPLGISSFFDQFGLKGFIASRATVGGGVGYASTWWQRRD